MERTISPSSGVKRRLSQVLAERWAMEVVRDALSLRAGQWEEARRRAGIFRIYNVADTPNTNQSRRVGGIRVETVEVPFQRFVLEGFLKEVNRARELEPRHEAARQFQRRLGALDEAGLARELRRMIASTEGRDEFARARAEPVEPYAPPPVRDDLVEEVVRRLGADAVRTRLLAYEVAVGYTVTNALRRVFAEPAEGDILEGIVQRFDEELVRNVDFGAENLVDGFLLRGSARVLGDLHRVVKGGHPDIVVLEGEVIGRQKVWNHAHVFEVKSNNSALTKAQKAAAAKAESCEHVDYHVLRFHLDYELRPARLEVTTSGEPSLFDSVGSVE